MQLVVVPAVIEIRLEPAAHLKTAIWRNRYVAQIKEAMDIGAEQQTVRRYMLAAVGIGANMCCIQNGQRLLARDGQRR